MNTLDTQKHGWLVGVGVVLVLIGLGAWHLEGVNNSVAPAPDGGGASAPPVADPAPLADPAPHDDVEVYHGLSDDEKQAIWRDQLPAWTVEERKDAMKENEP